MRSAVLLLSLGVSSVGQAGAQPTVTATLDADERLPMPVAHRYLHGVIPDDAKFQLALPDHWNGRLAVFSRGFSGTELTTGAFKTTALEKGYAFAASDEGWNRLTIASRPQDTYAESRPRIRELTLYAKQVLKAHYGKAATRTLIMGGSNGGHHAKWMLESYPELYDGGLAGYGFNSQVSQWGGIATVLRHYDVIAPRIDDIIAKRSADPEWDPARTALAPPLTAAQLGALQHIYEIPAVLPPGVTFNVGRWKGSEARWKSQHDALLGYLRDSMPRFDASYNPDGGPLTDDELKLWDPLKSPPSVQEELRTLDLSGHLKRPVIVMHGTLDPIVSPGETVGYRALVERRVGVKNAETVLAAYLIPGMGHGGAEYDQLIGAQLDALEQWIDFRQSGGKRGAPAPAALGNYPRESGALSGAAERKELAVRDTGDGLLVAALADPRRRRSSPMARATGARFASHPSWSEAGLWPRIGPAAREHHSGPPDADPPSERTRDGEEHDLPVVRQGCGGRRPLLHPDLSRQRDGGDPPRTR